MNPKEQMSAILDDFYNKIANGEEIPDDYERVPEVEKHVFFKLPLRQDKILNPFVRNELNQIVLDGMGLGNITLALENKSDQSYFIDIEVGGQYIMSLKLKSGNIEWIFGRYFIPLVGLRYHSVELRFRIFDPEENNPDEVIRGRSLVEPDYQNIWIYYADIETGLKNVVTADIQGHYNPQEHDHNQFIFSTFIIRWMSTMMGKANIDDNRYHFPPGARITTFDPHPDELSQPHHRYVLK